MSRFQLHTFLPCSILAMLIATAAKADIITAQSTIGSPTAASVMGFGNQVAVAQSFTANVSGPLSTILLNLSITAPADPLHVNLYTASGDLPTTTLLGSTTTTAASIINGDNTFDFTSQNIPITAGTKYVIVASATNESFVQYQWNGTAFNPYLDGAGNVSNDAVHWTGAIAGSDFAFQANVVPEPASAAFIAGAAMLLASRRRRLPVLV